MIVFLLILYSLQCGGEHSHHSDSYESRDLFVEGNLIGGHGKYFLEHEPCNFDTKYRIECGEGCIGYIMTDEQIDEFIMFPNTEPANYEERVEVFVPTDILPPEEPIVNEDDDAEDHSDGEVSVEHENFDNDDDDDDDDDGTYIETILQAEYYVLIFNNKDWETSYFVEKVCPQTPSYQEENVAIASGVGIFITLVMFCCCLMIGCLPIIIFAIVLVTFLVVVIFMVKTFATACSRNCNQQQQQQQQGVINGDQNVVTPVPVPVSMPVVNQPLRDPGVLDSSHPVIYSEQTELEDLKTM